VLRAAGDVPSRCSNAHPVWCPDQGPGSSWSSSCSSWASDGCDGFFETSLRAHA
jgi:hypothetical protein